MKCSHCGADNLENARFCQECGKSLVEKENTGLPEPSDEQSEADSVQAEFSGEKAEESVKEKKEVSGQRDTTFSELLDEITAEISKKPLEILREIEKEPVQKIDTECPFCHSKNCQPMQKNSTTVTKSGYSMSNGCCGMCLLGPFGLLCGLCGTRTKVDVKNESWWTCMDCGKEHISQKSATEKLEAMIAGLYGISLFGGVLLSLAIWSFGFSFISLVLVFMAFGMPYGGWCAALEMAANDLGYSITEILPIEKKRAYFHQFIGCMAIVVLVGLLFMPVLSSLAEE